MVSFCDEPESEADCKSYIKHVAAAWRCSSFRIRYASRAASVTGQCNRHAKTIPELELPADDARDVALCPLGDWSGLSCTAWLPFCLHPNINGLSRLDIVSADARRGSTSNMPAETLATASPCGEH